MVTWEVCFAAGHRKLNDLYVGEPRKLAAHCIKCYAAWLDHHGMYIIGMDHGMKLCMSGTCAWKAKSNLFARRQPCKDAGKQQKVI